MQYVNIKDAIAEQIESGQLTPKQKLPSERVLADSFGTTRVTLREALSLLEADGKIYREDRRGWFISPEPFRYDPVTGFDFDKQADEQNRVATTKLISAKLMLANKQATEMLALPAFTQVFCLHKIHYLEDRPVASVTQYVRFDLFPELLKQDLNVPLSVVYQQFEQSYQQINYRLAASALYGETAQALRATVGSPATLIERVNCNQQHEKIDCALEYWRNDAMTVESTSLITS